MKVRYRQADEGDLEKLIALGSLMHRESPRFNFLGYDEARLEALGRVLITAGGVFIAESEDGEVVGMMVGFMSDHYFSDDKVAQDLAVYVHPDHRGGSTAVRLIKMFEKWAFDSGARVMSMGISTGIDVERTAALYGKLGYSRTGVLMTKRNPAEETQSRACHRVKGG